MTEPQQRPTRGARTDADVENARRLAAAHTEVSRELEAFLRRMSPVPDAPEIAEFATLLAREEAVRADRDEALYALGLQTASIEGP